VIIGPSATASKNIPIPKPLSSKTYGQGPSKKLGVGVLEHCIAAGVVARELIKKVLPPYVTEWIGSDILSIFPFIVACHDIGKISAGFQYMIRGMTIPFDSPEFPIDPK